MFGTLSFLRPKTSLETACRFKAHPQVMNFIPRGTQRREERPQGHTRVCNSLLRDSTGPFCVCILLYFLDSLRFGRTKLWSHGSVISKTFHPPQGKPATRRGPGVRASGASAKRPAAARLGLRQARTRAEALSGALPRGHAAGPEGAGPRRARDAVSGRTTATTVGGPVPSWERRFPRGHVCDAGGG